MESPTLPRRRWAWTASLLAVLVAWVASVPARAADDGHDWALKAQTDEGISQVWRTDGVASEEGFFRAWFATFENPNVKPPSTPWERSYADFLWTCAQYHKGAYLKALTDDERASIENLLFAYTATLTTDHGNSFFLSVPAAQTDCDDPLILPDVYQNRADDTLDLTILGSALHESPPQQLLDKMHAWRTGTPVGITDLFALYIADTYPALLGFDKKATLALMPAYGSPRELIGQKTTPSFAYNRKVADELALPIGWDQMGMNDYWDFGYTPIHSFLARMSYEHPLITALVPIIGPALSAGDGWLTLLEGKDAAGQDANRLLGAGSFAINWAFAVADVGFVKGLSIGTYKTLREGARLAKKLATPGEAKALMLSLRKALREAPQAGPEAHRALTRLGDPVDPHLNLWVEALGFDEKAGRTYGQLMRNAVRLAAMRARHATTTGSKMTYKSVRKVIETGSNVVARRLKNKDAANFAKVRSLGDGLGTYINGKYERFADRIREFCLKHGIKRTGYCEVQVVGVIDGTEIPLTHMAIFEMKVGRFGWGGIQHWAHDFVPDAQLVTKIDDHLELLFKKAIDPKATREEIVAAVAEIQWWEANTTRWVRGTQGISDATSKALLEARGIEVGRWKPDVSPDFEAFVRSKDDFVASYPDLFIRSADTPAPVLKPVPLYKMPEPNGAYPFSIASAYSDNGIVGYGAVSVTGKIYGWAVDHSRLENVDDFPEEQWGGIQFDISVREVVGDEETEVEKIEASLPSPPEMPAEWIDKGKSHHGFEWEIPADKEAATLRVYAVHPFLENEEVLLFETAGNTCEPEPCNSTVDWKWAFCDFACECQPACLCVQPDFINGGCLLWDDQWSCPGEPNPVFCF
jgi:hypothetical protein